MDSMLDRQWKYIFANTPLFTTIAEIEMGDESNVQLHGFFHSGTYGVRSEVKYVRERTVLKHSFEFAEAELQCPRNEVLRKKVLIDGHRYVAMNIYGGRSGILVMELADADSTGQA